MSTTAPQTPLIAIVGATGTGKSQLAVALARRFSGEIINGDALQLYKGLPIATNKIPFDDRRGIPHHLLGCIGLEEEPWTVSNFVKEAAKTVAEISERGKVPILVGGTHYYTQSLLFEDAVVDEGSERLSAQEQERRWPILARSSEEMLEELQKLDPVMAKKWHPRDGRKIRRSLEIWLRTGKRASELYADQHKLRSGAESPTDWEGEISTNPLKDIEGRLHSVHRCLRYNTLIFWVYDDPEILRERLNNRVDEMIEQGLLPEIQSMDAVRWARAEAGLPLDTTKGIWVAIGYKEFNEYRAAVQGSSSDIELARLKVRGAELTKIATRQYAKRQDRWIRLKLLQALQDAGAASNIYPLVRSNQEGLIDSTACEITAKFLYGQPLPSPLSLSETASRLLDSGLGRKQDTANDHVRHCDLCQTSVATEKSWIDHLTSKRHGRMLKSKKNPTL